MAKPLVSVIIPTYRDWDRCLECLAALEKQTVDPGEIEIIVVNNDPSDPCLRAELLASNVRIIDEGNPGSYAARNAGVAASSGSILAFTDSDCCPAPDWLRAAITAIHSHGGDVRVTGPIKIFRPDGCQDLAYLYDRKFAFDQFSERRFNHAVTANLVVPRSVFERVGPFAARMLSGGDFEWNTRASAMKVPLAFDEAVIVHHPSRRDVTELALKERRVAGGNVALRRASTVQTILSRLKPPINKIRAIDRSDMTNRETFQLLMLIWHLRVIALVEHLLVRFNLKAPERR